MKPSPIFEVDIVIIGAGPAGLSTALHLLQLDPEWSGRLVLLEKEKHPRHKLCGGGITCLGLDHLHSLGLTLGVPFVPVTTATLRYRDQSVNILGDPVFIVTWRSEFDAWLAECARARGVNLIENSPVTRLEKLEDRIQITTPDASYVANVVVGADGSRGVVRGWLGARERPAHVARVLESITPASGHENVFENHEARFVYDYLHSHHQGYFWVFPSLKNDRPFLNTGVYDARVDADKPKADLKRIMEEGLHRIEIDFNSVKVEGHPIRWFSPWNQFSDHRVILVGDAAGTDPLFGEGIGVSLAYGAIAARTLRSAFGRQDFSFTDYRKSVIASSVGRYLLLRWCIASVVSRIQGSDILIRGLWKFGCLLARFLRPSSPIPEVYPLQFTPVEQMSESVGD